MDFISETHLQLVFGLRCTPLIYIPGSREAKKKMNHFVLAESFFFKKKETKTLVLRRHKSRAAVSAYAVYSLLPASS
jgi:hypothetical protein